MAKYGIYVWFEMFQTKLKVINIERGPFVLIVFI